MAPTCCEGRNGAVPVIGFTSRNRACYDQNGFAGTPSAPLAATAVGLDTSGQRPIPAVRPRENDSPKKYG